MGYRRNWVSTLRVLRDFQPFPNFDQFAQINRKISPTERLYEESCLKQPEEDTIQELDKNSIRALIFMRNIYWFELFLTIIQGYIGDSGGGGRVGDEELGKHLPFVIVIGVQKIC